MPLPKAVVVQVHLHPMVLTGLSRPSWLKVLVAACLHSNPPTVVRGQLVILVMKTRPVKEELFTLKAMGLAALPISSRLIPHHRFMPWESVQIPLVADWLSTATVWDQPRGLEVVILKIRVTCWQSEIRAAAGWVTFPVWAKASTFPSRKAMKDLMSPAVRRMQLLRPMMARDCCIRKSRHKSGLRITGLES